MSDVTDVQDKTVDTNAQEAAFNALQDAMRRDVQLEIQMRVQAMSLAVQAKQEADTALSLAQKAETFLKFLKQGTAPTGETNE